MRSTASSFAHCERIARRAAANFYPAFRVLPARQRKAMCALYAFNRISDDIADGPGSAAERRARLKRWSESVAAAFDGEPSHPIHPALAEVVRTYAIPRQYFWDVLDGVASDLDPVAFADFAELYAYCYRVASAVGLMCIHVWGFRGEQALADAEAAGVALQLTNILRDLGEDLDRDRVYLPKAELDRFGCDLRRRDAADAAFRDMMRFQVGRAKEYYATSARLNVALAPAGRAVFGVMVGTYRGILDLIERRDYDVFSSRVRVGRWKKMRLMAAAMPVRWGWLGG